MALSCFHKIIGNKCPYYRHNLQVKLQFPDHNWIPFSHVYFHETLHVDSNLMNVVVQKPRSRDIISRQWLKTNNPRGQECPINFEVIGQGHRTWLSKNYIQILHTCESRMRRPLYFKEQWSWQQGIYIYKWFLDHNCMPFKSEPRKRSIDFGVKSQGHMTWINKNILEPLLHSFGFCTSIFMSLHIPTPCGKDEGCEVY